MNSEKYIGLDVHQATIVVAVTDSTGKLIMESILETEAATILQFFAGLRGTLSVTFEEGTWSAWRYDLLKPHVAQRVVCHPRKKALLKDGNKSDRIDARKLAERLRGNQLKPVYHGGTGVRMLRELSRSYLTIVKDLSRAGMDGKRCTAVGRFPVPEETSMTPGIEPSGWRNSGKRVCAVEPNDSMSNWTCCATCVSKPGGNCGRKVGSMPSRQSCPRFRIQDRFDRRWR
jgi:Transposase